ncbi:hybrid sensor histidine kinase/response regulator transcription factor [Dyadobacter aurulentus]|uniref:hybrid sensor histidine kinase/response regulator transcription factor n=1 Tax=Dyadobacter sp. UC 10 TaxID=2605428 RepID=UPI0011F0D62B|nr:hybrid sensor histidine kinase/response regulator transcription factor [Dyadobacter sp. UC 10]KAA0988723.1 helix-turn-helix domain-containing protein [Dyadobacter sp. UC 10]
MRLLKELLLTFFLTTAPGLLRGQSDQLRFLKLDVRNGLSNNHPTCFLLDSQGFMWVGTNSGLNRYDGYHFKVFRNDASDSTSLRSNSIRSLWEGPKGKVWASSATTNSVYDPLTEKFAANTSHELKQMGISPGFVRIIHKDGKGNYWFAQENNGLFNYIPAAKGKAAHLLHAPKDTNSISSNEISAIANSPDRHLWIMHRNGILEKVNPQTRKVVWRSDYLAKKHKLRLLNYGITVDSDGELWIYAIREDLGVHRFNPSELSFSFYNKTQGNPRLNSDIIQGVVQDNQGRIWIGVDHGGINLIDKKKNEVSYILPDDDDRNAISQNTFNAIYKDASGVIWLGTYKDGVNYYHEDIFRFPLFKHKRSQPASLPYNDLNRFLEDKKGNIWMGANGGGLIYFDRQRNTYKQYLHDAANSNSLGSNVVISLFLDRQETLWIGTYFGGLSSFDGQNFKTYRHNPADPGSLSHHSVWEIKEDSRGNLWIGTLDGGLELFDRQTEKFTHYPARLPGSVHDAYISEITEDDRGNLWLGTSFGVDIRDAATGKFTNYHHEPGKPNSLSNNIVHAIVQDSKKRIWVGTQDGLNLYDPVKKQFRVFRQNDGLPHNTALSVVEDDSGDIWIATPHGLARMQLAQTSEGLKIQFINYDESDGLQGSEFTENAALKTRDGALFFGGARGYNHFRPEQILPKAMFRNVVLSSLSVSNTKVNAGDKIGDGSVILTSAISETKKIVLPHSANIFAIDFAVLNFFHPQKISYLYKLEGFNEDWVPAQASSRTASYTNLDPGTYLFRVKASNENGDWNNEETTLEIEILPPWWNSPVAKLAYLALFIFALYAAAKTIRNKEREKYLIEQERRESRRLREINDVKIRFFTNMSHEFRTPLTLILSPLEKILKENTDSPLYNQMQLMQRNAKRLLNLVNQLLDFRKLEVSGIRFNPTEGDIVQFVKEAVFSFTDISQKKQVGLYFQSELQSLNAFFDQDKLEKILFNLLSNAFKFTPEHGKITVEIANARPTGSHARSWLEMKVRDTGIGIPHDKKDKIFESFFQNDLPAGLLNQGSGIGLSITKEFVNLHGGSITVDSEPGAGSCFKILIPVQGAEGSVSAGPIAEIASKPNPVPVLPTGPGADASALPVLLLVEDNEDFLFYLKDNLKEFYRIIEARNGSEGWSKAISAIPDLVVTDVTMPEMDGMELVRKLKNDERTLHIPLVLLTAGTSPDQHLQGYELGIHDYIEKPFNFEILQFRLSNILRQQEAARKTFSQHIAIKGRDIAISSRDENLVRQVIAIVEDNIGNADFSVEALSREVGMSRIHLYRKLNAISGKTPVEFIRSIRMERAARLLEQSQLTISEVAYQVGFNNPKYFARQFKDEFGELPSAYLSKRKNKA